MLPSILKFAEGAAIIEERESNQFDLTYHPKLNDPIKIKWPRTIAENLIFTSKLSINFSRLHFINGVVFWSSMTGTKTFEYKYTYLCMSTQSPF